MAEFVNVPVPEDLVIAVMAFITDQTAPASPEPAALTDAASEVASAGTDASRDWTREQLRLLHGSTFPSVQLFCQVLSSLAEVSPDPIPAEQLGERLGLDALTMKKTFGAVTRWMKNRLGPDVRWPIEFPAGGWAMNEHNASLWREVTTE